VTPDDAHVVGLAVELARLHELLEQARAAGPVVVLVEGPAGSGKTTLLRRFLLAHPGVQVAQVAGLAWESRRAGALAGRLVGAPPASGAALSDAGALGEELARLWAAQARQEVLVVVVDDVSHADVESLQALVSAVVRLRDERVLLLLVRTTGWRPSTTPEADEVLDRLAATRVTVRPLDAEQTRLLAARVAAVDLPAPVARRLREHTAGTPGHLLQVLRETAPAQWSDWQTRLHAPSGVQRRVEAGLARCAPATRALVEAAAVLGAAPHLADAATMAGIDDPPGAVDAVDEACALGLLVVAAGHGMDVLAFPERFVRDAVRATLTPRARHELHLRAAEVVTDDTERLRHRVEAAPLPDEALAGELVELARRKAGEGAWALVAGALLDASRISPTRADREDRLLQAVDALAGAGLLGQAVEALPEVEALPSSTRRNAVLAHVAVQRGRRAEAAAYLDDAWRARGGDRQGAAVACQRYVLHALADWDGDALVQWASRAVEHARPGSPPAVESRAIVGLGHAARGHLTEAATAYRRAVDESPTGPQHQRARMGQGWLALAQDDPVTARRHLELAVSTVRQTGSNRIALWALVWLARTRFALGDWRGALQAVDQAEVLLAATGLELLRPLVHWTGAQVRALQGDQDEAERHLRLGTAAQHDYTVMVVPALLARAHHAEASSDYAAVVRHLTPLVTRSARGGLDEPGFWPWHDVYANALVLTDRLAEADAFLAPLEVTARRRRHRSTTARLGYVRGRLLAGRGDLPGAHAAFEQARSAVAALPLPYEQARVEFAHGITLRRAGLRREAAVRLSTARQGFAELGAQVYVDRCDRELKTGRPAPPPADGGTEHGAPPGVLTQQEQTVAELVASGLTNKEAAAALVLSVKTVQFHLTRVYAKLGVRSRSELAARFVQDRAQR
jgi:DNA-binding CsgD family transcriptional regulator/tetratricopeptide (TPR) repeat protein